MKICFITNLYAPFIIGGAEIYVERITRHMAGHNDIVIITGRPFHGIRSLWPSQEKNGRVTVYRFFPLNFYFALYAKRRPFFLKPLWHMLDIWNAHAFVVIRGILAHERPDVVHTHNVNGFSLSVRTAIRKLKASWIHTVHDFSLLCPFANLRCPLRDTMWCSFGLSPCSVYRLLKKAAIDNKPDTVIFPSQACKRVFDRYGFFTGCSHRILPYCIEVPAAPARAQHDAGTAGFDILYAGQLVEHKGVQYVIRAFKRLSISGLRLHIAGDGEYRQALENMADGDGRIRFYGNVAYSRLQELYRSCDVSVVPSVWPEVLGIVILEALSHGTPVIASDIGGIPEIITNGYNGILVKPADADALRAVIELLHAQPELLNELRAHALESSKIFDVSNHTRTLAALYDGKAGTA